jgi:hypothetical protein
MGSARFCVKEDRFSAGLTQSLTAGSHHCCDEEKWMAGGEVQFEAFHGGRLLLDFVPQRGWQDEETHEQKDLDP